MEISVSCKELKSWALILVGIAGFVVDKLKRTERTKPEYRTWQDAYKQIAQAYSSIKGMIKDYCPDIGSGEIPPLPKPPAITEMG